MFDISKKKLNLLLLVLPGTLVTVMVNGFWFDWLLDDVDGPLAGVTETDGGICVFLADDGRWGSENVFCSLAADKPNTISSNLRRRFSLPPETGSSTGGGGGACCG